MIRFAGIAGGVGTTTLATIVGGADNERNVFEADVIVAMNDYRSISALVDLGRDYPEGMLKKKVLAIRTENKRSIDVSLMLKTVPEFGSIVIWFEDLAIARADDAGLLQSGTAKLNHLREQVEAAYASVTGAAK